MLVSAQHTIQAPLAWHDYRSVKPRTRQIGHSPSPSSATAFRTASSLLTARAALVGVLLAAPDDDEATRRRGGTGGGPWCTNSMMVAPCGMASVVHESCSSCPSVGDHRAPQTTMTTWAVYVRRQTSSDECEPDARPCTRTVHQRCLCLLGPARSLQLLLHAGNIAVQGHIDLIHSLALRPHALHKQLLCPFKRKRRRWRCSLHGLQPVVYNSQASAREPTTRPTVTCRLASRVDMSPIVTL